VTRFSGRMPDPVTLRSVTMPYPCSCSALATGWWRWMGVRSAARPVVRGTAAVRRARRGRACVPAGRRSARPRRVRSRCRTARWPGCPPGWPRVGTVRSPPGSPCRGGGARPCRRRSAAHRLAATAPRRRRRWPRRAAPPSRRESVVPGAERVERTGCGRNPMRDSQRSGAGYVPAGRTVQLRRTNTVPGASDRCLTTRRSRRVICRPVRCGAAPRRGGTGARLGARIGWVIAARC
jgi:hypothetical protein